MKWALAICLLALSACESVPKEKEVSVPVLKECLSKRPVTPDMKFDLLPKAKSEAEAAEHARILWLDRQVLLTHSIEWQTAAAGCQVISK